MGLVGLGLKGHVALCGPSLPRLTSWSLLHIVTHPHELNSMWVEAVSMLFAIVWPASATAPGTDQTLSAYLLNNK